MWTCKICNANFNSLMGRASHLKAKHDISVNEYYSQFPIFCECGCGTIVRHYYKFAHGHHRRGKKLPEESRERIRQAQLGHISPTKGIPRTDKDKAAMRLAITPEKRKIRSEMKKEQWRTTDSYQFMYGELNPSKRPEVAAKIGAAQLGRKHTKEQRKKQSLARIGKPGVIVSDKRKAEYSERMRRDNPMHRKEVLENHPVLKSGIYFMSIGEKKLSDVFKDLQLNFVHQMKLQKEKGYYSADFFFPDYNKIIEFDGHESHRINPESDIRRDAYILERYGYQTLRLLSPELNNRNREQLLQTIKEFLNETKTAENIKQTDVRRIGRRVRSYSSR